MIKYDWKLHAHARIELNCDQKNKVHHFQNRIHRSKALSKENSKIIVPGLKTVNLDDF